MRKVLESQEGRVAPSQLATISDLLQLKRDLIEEIKVLLRQLSGLPGKKWLKSYEVRKVLGMSPGTLHTLRNNGTIPYTKVGSILYYNAEDIEKLLQKNK